MVSSSLQSLLFTTLIVLFLSDAAAAALFRPRALILPVVKDATTGQHVAALAQGTPRAAAKLTVDLGGESLWLDCEKRPHSSTYRRVLCHTADCNLHSTSKFCPAKSSGASDATCGEFVSNTIANVATGGDFSHDIVSVSSTNGFNPGRAAFVPKFFFTCVSGLEQGLASGAVGMAGLGWIKTSLPLQLSAAFRFPRKFAVCLGVSGFIIFGDAPVALLPSNEDFSRKLTYTPLIRNRVNPITGVAGEPSADYYIGVTSIRVGGKPVPLNAKLLSIDSQGVGGTKISTVLPYTVMETSIYKAIVAAFVAALGRGAARVAPVAPFGACFRSKGLGSTRVGPAVPRIDLVLQEASVAWQVFGSNSMVSVGGEVSCLAVVDGGPLRHAVHSGGKFTTAAIEIGTRQIEDNLLQFDLASSRLGFSSSLLFRQTTCSNFNFTSVAN